MTPEQWSVVNRVFHDAADLPVAERVAFIQQESGGDLTIQSAVTGLLRADSHRGDYLSLPAAAKPEFQSLLLSPPESTALLQAGDILGARFEIVRQLGEGGMGQVYEAFDQDLQVRIALKVIQPEIAALEGMTNRFRHEVRLARSITHSNICRTFDLEYGTIVDSIGTSRDLVFLTMEYLEGETLGVRLAGSTPLTLHDALTIAEQLAAGIDAAHRHGVVHRDLKPQNALLAKVPNADAGTIRVVIMDFGLARLNPTSFTSTPNSTTSQHGQVTGTFAYMAPEQIVGGAALPASDIYSFGLILFEMVTGRKAFPVESFLPDLSRRLGDQPPSPRSIDPSLPEVWEAAITRCLARRPEERFPTAGDVVEALHNGLPIRKRVYSRFSLRFVAAVLVVLFAVLSSFVLVSRFTKIEKMNSPVPLGALVYMPPVKNQTHNPRLSQIAQMMRVALAQSSRIAVLDEAQEADTLQRMVRPLDTPIDATTAREIAMRTGVRRIILVTLTEEDALLHLLVSVQQPEANNPGKPRLHIERSWTCGAQAATAAADIPADLLHIVRDASDWVRQTAGEANEDIVNLNAPVEDLTTSNWGAFAAYTRGDRLQQQGRSSDAVLALAEAVHLDADFALAYARMGDILFSLSRASEGLEAYRKALDAGEQRRLTRRERDRIRGQYAIDTWDFQAAEAVFRDATVFYERDYLSWFYRGSVLMSLNRFPEAIETLRTAAAFRPGSLSAPLTAASAMFITGDRKQALETAASLERAGHPAEALWLKAEGAFLDAGDELGSATSRRPAERDTIEDTETLLRQIDHTGSGTLRSQAVLQRVRLAANRGDIPDALALLNAGIVRDRAEGENARVLPKQMDRAYLLCATGRFDPCLEDVHEALNTSPDPDTVRQAAAVFTRALAKKPPAAIKQRLHRAIQEAMLHAPGAVYGVSSEIVHAQLTAALHLSEDQTAKAIRDFRRVAVMDAPVVASLQLARSLHEAAQLEPDPDRRQATLAEAARICPPLHELRPLLWYYGLSLPPTALADAVAFRSTASPRSPPEEGLRPVDSIHKNTNP